MNIKELLLRGTKKLKTANIENPRLDTEILLCFALQVNKNVIFAHDDLEVAQKQIETFQKLLEKRENHIPIAYITGEKEFYRLTFKVNENVLIPRPDTETLVDAVIEKYKRNNNSLNILDLCAGSGCIGLALLKNINGTLTLADISKKALDVANENAAILKLSERVVLIESDLFQEIPLQLKFDVIVSNPPYIPSNAINALTEDVKKEPKLALDGGDDGLKYYRKIIVTAKNYLKKDGALFLEIGVGESETVQKIMTENNYSNVKIKKDLAGIERVVIGENKDLTKLKQSQ